MTYPLVWQLFDLLLAALMLVMAWASMASRDIRRGVVLFIAFGLLMSLVWARLSAPDLALAEAAIGAGLSGALLLAALRDRRQKDSEHPFAPARVAIPVSLACLILATGFAWILVVTLEGSDPIRQAEQIRQHLVETGVANPVTAVLLSFRAYDTMLELAVLLVAVLGILALGPARRPYLTAGPLFSGLIRWLTPLLILTAGYLLWAGADEPGGAFQAGAMVGAAAVMLRLGGSVNAGLPRGSAVRFLLVVGVVAFALVGIIGMLGGLAFLQYPDGWSGALILMIETAATLAIGATLALAYIGGATDGWNSGLSTREPAGGRGQT